MWYLLLQWLGSTISPCDVDVSVEAWAWTKASEHGSIPCSTLRIPFLLRASRTSVVSLCIIRPIHIQTPSFHSIATPLIMIVTMRGNVPHSTNQTVNQVDWRILGQYVVSKWVHSFLDELVKHSLPIRRQFHKLHSALPPPPPLQQHNYC